MFKQNNKYKCMKKKKVLYNIFNSEYNLYFYT